MLFAANNNHCLFWFKFHWIDQNTLRPVLTQLLYGLFQNRLVFFCPMLRMHVWSMKGKGINCEIIKFKWGVSVEYTSISLTVISSSFIQGQSWLPKEVAIKRSPDSPEVQAGSRVEFRCDVNGCQQVLYRWFKDEQELPGGNNSTLILDPLKMQDFGSYRCKVRSDKRDDVPFVPSNVVELDVTPAEGESELIYDCPELHWTVSYKTIERYLTRGKRILSNGVLRRNAYSGPWRHIS